MSSFGLLAVDWGQQGVLPAEIARDRTRAETLLGTSLVSRMVLGIVVYLVLAIGCRAFGYQGEVQWALALVFAFSVLCSFANAFKDTIRGFERTDIPAYAQVAQQLLIALVLAPVLMLGGKMRAALFSQVLVLVFVVIALWLSLRVVGVRKLSFEASVLGPLFKKGTPFVFFGVAMVLQPNIDALYLSKLAPSEVMGWFAVSRRLVGVLVFPASALLGALYPTLCRLHATDLPGFTRNRAWSIVQRRLARGAGCRRLRPLP
ncbi:MAG: oligosaccharide flippase family protein [Pseudomonadota bacterium]